MNQELKKYEKVIRPLMKDKRYTHSVNVAETALALAKKFGCDEDKAYTAAILHDCQKEVPKDVMKREMLESGYFVDKVEIDTPKLWHGIAGAYYVKNVLKIEDSDILNAIRFHTVGRAYMSTLEKIVFLADMVSAERDYEDVEKYRAFVFADLDNGMYETLRWSVSSLAQSGSSIPLTTIEAFNFYNNIRKNKVK